MTTFYLEVEAPSIGALNDKLRQFGVINHADPAGRLGYEVHYWDQREEAQTIADKLTADGYQARVAIRH